MTLGFDQQSVLHRLEKIRKHSFFKISMQLDLEFFIVKIFYLILYFINLFEFYLGSVLYSAIDGRILCKIHSSTKLPNSQSISFHNFLSVLAFTSLIVW